MRRIALVLALTAAALWLIAPAASAQADDQNCADFASQADAQAHLDADTTDPDNLDGDNDGQACEAYPYSSPVPTSPPVTTGGGQALPFTGSHTAPTLTLGAGLLAAGGLALRLSRRRAT